MEENALFMLNNIETSHLKVKINPKVKEIKISIKLFKGSNQIGLGELLIPISLVQAREVNMKKWITLNPPNIKSKKIDPLVIINKVKLNVNVIITYPDGGKADNNSKNLKNKNVSAPKKNSLNKSTIEPRSKIGKNISINHLDEIDNEDDIGRHSKSMKKSFTNSQNYTISTNTNRNFFKNDMNNISMEGLNTPFTNKLSSLNLDNATYFDSIDDENLPNLENKLKVMNSGNDKVMAKPNKFVKHVEVTDKNSKKKKVDFDETFDSIKIPNSSNLIKDNKIEAISSKDKNIKTQPKKEAPKDTPQKIAELSEYIDDTFDEEFICDYDINKNTDDEDDLTKLEEILNDFQAYYNDSLFKALPADEFYLKFELKMLNEKFLEFQDNYYNKMKDLILSHARLKSFSVKYYEKYRNMKKNLNEVRDQIQTLDDTSELREFTVRRENNLINNILSTLRNEVHTMKFLMNIQYNNQDIGEYVKIANDKNSEKKKILLEITLKIFNKRKNLTKCGLINEFMLRKIFNKNGMYLKEEHEMEPDTDEDDHPEKHVEEQKTVKNDIIGENHFENSINEIRIRDKAREEEFAIEDDLTVLLKHSLDDFYGNKKIDRIEFKKLSDGSYLFGTRKVIITIEDDYIMGIYI